MSGPPEETESSQKQKVSWYKSASILAAVLWVASIVLAFIIKPGTALICLPDCLLLLGFVPLLLVWNRSWGWAVFGITNGAIGFFVLLLRYIPDTVFPPESIVVKHHLTEYHPYEPWVIIGGLCFAYGLILLITRISGYVLNRAIKSKK